MQDLVQIEVYKYIYGGKPKQIVGEKLLYDLIVGMEDFEGVMADLLKVHGKGHYAIAQHFSDIEDNGLISLNGPQYVLEFEDLNDPI